MVSCQQVIWPVLVCILFPLHSYYYCCCCCCCQVILRREPASAQDACAVSSVGLGDQASLLPDIWPDQAEQEWHIDPSYYQYQVCECLFVSTAGTWGLGYTSSDK
jgi:hypothetical protein